MLEVLPLLLVPVAALLFLNLRLSRKLRYPHDLLEAEARRGMASFLFRNFRTYYDVLLDGLLAVALAFALAPPRRPRPSAVVIDGSRAMTAGFANERPLVKALKRMRTDPALQGAQPFLLTLDPECARTRLVPIKPLLAGASVEEAAGRLQEAFTFFAPDYGRLADLRKEGYGGITLLTDQRRVRSEGFQIVELGMATPFSAFPASARYDRPSRSWQVCLVESGYRASLLVSGWDGAQGRFAKLARDRYAVEEGAAGRIVRFPNPGLYLLSLKGPYGLEDIDLPVFLAPRPTSAAAGPFSERMLSIFRIPERLARPDVVLADLGASAPAGGRRVTTALLGREGALVLDPARARGALLAVGRVPGADLALGPSSLANEDLVLAYDACLAPQEAPFQTEPAPGGPPLLPAGQAFLQGPEAPLVPPPSQFFETRPGPRLVLPPAASRRWPWAALLALLATAKLVVWVKLTGRPLLGRS